MMIRIYVWIWRFAAMLYCVRPLELATWTSGRRPARTCLTTMALLWFGGVMGDFP